MPKHIVVTGPESTGKSVLSKALSQTLDLPLQPEIARYEIEILNRPYTAVDVQKMAMQHYQMEQEILENKRTVFDTDLTVYQIWLSYKYGSAPDWITTYLKRNAPSKNYLLLYPDLPWQPDPLREAPVLETRMELFELYKKLLDTIQASYGIVKGHGEARFQNSLEILAALD